MEKINPAQDTIAAIATPFGEGAVGIVRLSGPQAVSVADRVFLSKNGKPLANLKTYSLKYGWIVSEKQKTENREQRTEEEVNQKIRPLSSDNIIDEVIVSVMRAPKSYTREDVVEINSHGGPKALSSILELVLENGARLAQPGEFTKRAFLNGRLDLAQAEAVLDIIQAKSDLALKIGMSQLSGEISRRISGIRSSMLAILADMEASIDFPEENIGKRGDEEFLKNLTEISFNLKGLLEGSFRGKIIREGLKVVIYGRTNVGKSSLLNALLKQERAIVTPVAGTTRDTIEESISIKGLAVRLIDTAGILEHRDEIEKEALARTRRALQECDLVIFVLDGTSPLTEEDRILAAEIRSKKTLIVMNKCDLPQRFHRDELRPFFSQEPLEVSALKGENIDRLEELIWRSVFDSPASSQEGLMVSNVRHIEILKRALRFLETSLDSLKKKLSVEFVALDLKKALGALDELTGDAYDEEILDIIFSKFCIGK